MKKTLLASAVLLALMASGAARAQTDPTQLSAREAVEKIRSGRLSSLALTQAYIDKAQANADLNAFIVLDTAGALAAAKSRDTERGAAGALLHGLPMVVKANIQVAGLPASAGTPALKDAVAATDAPVVARLRKAGAVILGMTNMHELAFGVSGYNEGFHGAQVGVRNAYDRSRAAGGSSSGTGAAVGARLAPAGLGTDTGGSARVPAAFNGVAGFRPTVLRYPQAGIVPISHTRDTAGVLAQTVSDVALIDAAIMGQAPVKPARLQGVRLGVVRDYFFQNLDADTAAVTEWALGELRNAGARIVEVPMPGLADLNNAQSFPIALYEAYDDLQAYLRRYVPGQSVASVAAQVASADVKGTYDALVIPRQLPGPNNTLVEARPIYDAAVGTHRPQLQKLYAQTFRQHRLDALVFPTTPIVALAQNAQASSLPHFARIIQNTDPGSNAGIPGLSIPAGIGGSGLPVGLEIDAPAGADRRLLALGMAIENALGRLPAPTAR